MTLAPGLMVGPNLRLARPLGEGGMGEVWVADHLTLHTEVAVKVINADLAHDPELLERFRREASLAASIKSPHVVQMLDHGVMPTGAPYIAMELLVGESLADRLGRGRSLAFDEAAVLLTQVCEVLSKAHAIGVVHRDLKPENLFLVGVEYGLFVKVLDFGIAKRRGRLGGGLTGEHSILGTPHYMSPEQLLTSKHVDGRSDLWSMAVVVYAALTGILPFDADTLTSLGTQICRDDCPPIDRQLPGAPPGLQAWFDRALQKLPDDRFQTPEQMAAAFREVTAASPHAAATASIEDAPTEDASPEQLPPAQTVVARPAELPSLAASALPTAGQLATMTTLTAASATVEQASPPRRWPVIAGAAAVVAGGLAVGSWTLLEPRGAGAHGAIPQLTQTEQPPSVAPPESGSALTPASPVAPLPARPSATPLDSAAPLPAPPSSPGRPPVATPPRPAAPPPPAPACVPGFYIKPDGREGWRTCP